MEKAQAQELLEVIQGLEPAGVGARDLREVVCCFSWTG